MRSLSSLGVLLFLVLRLSAQSPHGTDFKMDCGECHTSRGWKIDKKTLKFNHNTTGFALDGQHNKITCRLCHPTLIFSQARRECMACHTDVHEQTLGFDCGRCHTPASWLVEDVTAIHQASRFPLLGAHTTASCYDCHPSASLLRFEPLGVECYDCHKADYQATTQPNHLLAGFSTDCSECHKITAFSWTGLDFNHSFFPLTGGHAIQDCSVCHKSPDYSNISSDCYSCHETDYTNAKTPDHLVLGFSTTCADCHSTNPGWSPADFKQHDGLYFPIYSGSHSGVWNACSDCHTNPSDYSINSCTICHAQPETDDAHNEVGGYVYQDAACLACHPNGSAEDSFNHDLTIFPLTGAHTTTDCLNCHSQGYAGTTTVCSDRHIDAYNQSQNPNHLAIGISIDCGSCHTTDPGWAPATFPVHNDYYPLNGAHANIANNCSQCHNGDYNNTPNTCFGCHETDYNQTSNPNHLQAQFSTDCQSCHTENAWVPSTFDHDGQYFPIYSGTHQGTWNECSECHINPSNYAIFDCLSCHPQGQTDEEHNDVGGYSYNSEACYACHPTGQAGDFNHNNTNFPLTGAHITTDCIDCHYNGYQGTTTICGDCHNDAYVQSSNPNHVAISIPNTCNECHTTQPGWAPATFPIHNNYWVFQGAHLSVAGDCAVCHNGNYNNTPNTCFGCHETDYNQTNDPPHLSAGFPTDCETCHTQNAWTPSTFDHDNQYFPIYSGHHQGVWDHCSDCHTNPNNYAVFDCLNCHPQGQMDDEHNDVPGYTYNSNACYNCHPTGVGGDKRSIRRL